LAKEETRACRITRGHQIIVPAPGITASYLDFIERLIVLMLISSVSQILLCGLGADSPEAFARLPATLPVCYKSKKVLTHSGEIEFTAINI
jgi:hypothetical protein